LFKVLYAGWGEVPVVASDPAIAGISAVASVPAFSDVPAVAGVPTFACILTDAGILSAGLLDFRQNKRIILSFALLNIRQIRQPNYNYPTDNCFMLSGQSNI
jgi:hypothetical protein